MKKIYILKYGQLTIVRNDIILYLNIIEIIINCYENGKVEFPGTSECLMTELFHLVSEKKIYLKIIMTLYNEV